MRQLLLVWFCCALLLGCGNREPNQCSHPVRYPALDESSPPPAPQAKEGDIVEVMLDAGEIPSVITGESWIDRQKNVEEMIRGLKEYSARADKDDPFALTEEEIRALLETEDPVLY